jgi:hypothetical protein
VVLRGTATCQWLERLAPYLDGRHGVAGGQILPLCAETAEEEDFDGLPRLTEEVSMSVGDWVNVGCAVLTGSAAIVAAWIGCGQSVQDASASVGMSMISKAGVEQSAIRISGSSPLWQRVPHRGNVVDAVPVLAQLLPRADPQLALRLVGAKRLSEPVDLP